jgi:predicted dehydrogenase
MATKRLGIIMHGVTGRMGMNQHLIRSEEKLAELGRTHGVDRWTTDIDAALAGDDEVFFDSAATNLRAGLLTRAMEAGKHVYCEKPTADSLDDALDLVRTADRTGVKSGVVQDKLFLPGLMKLRRFEGDWQPAQRPSWNYRKTDGGGIILDMLPHWRYVLDNIFAPVKSVSCLGTTHIPERWDETGDRYDADADDAAYATFELEGGVIAHINSSWCTRVRRDDLVTFHVDGTLGSAVAGLTSCLCQPRAATPKPVWNPDEPQPIDFFENWIEAPDNSNFDNGFKAEWEMFIRHVAEDAPFLWDLREGAKGVQLAEAGIQSWHERRWVDLEPLAI